MLQTLNSLLFHISFHLSIITLHIFYCTAQDLIKHTAMVMLYKGNNHCLEGREQAVFLT